MKCPVCDVALSISSREGVEIDFCPQCRGVWLDRGELDKVIERAAASLAPSGARGGRDDPDDRPPPRYDDRPRDDGRYDERRPDDRRYDDRRPDDRRYDDRRPDDRRYDKKKKRRSFLDDMFDFD
jgi:Zn-finger nucleic acid-binding protein